MTLKKLSIGVASLAFALSPALAQASPTGHGKLEGTPGKGKGPTQRSESGSQHAGGVGNHGKRNHGAGHGRGNGNHGQRPATPDKCTTHEVAYVASGTLVGDTLTKSEPANLYSGQVTVEVTHANRHAHAVRGETKTYTLQNVRVRGPIAVAALEQGDRVKLIGMVTSIAPKCESSTFTPTITITKLVFHMA